MHVRALPFPFYVYILRFLKTTERPLAGALPFLTTLPSTARRLSPKLVREGKTGG